MAEPGHPLGSSAPGTAQDAPNRLLANLLRHSDSARRTTARELRIQPVTNFALSYKKNEYRSTTLEAIAQRDVKPTIVLQIAIDVIDEVVNIVGTPVAYVQVEVFVPKTNAGAVHVDTFIVTDLV